MVHPFPSSISTGRKRSRPEARRTWREGRPSTMNLLALSCCCVAAARGRFAAAFTGVPPLPPRVTPTHGERASFQSVRKKTLPLARKREKMCRIHLSHEPTTPPAVFLERCVCVGGDMRVTVHRGVPDYGSRYRHQIPPILTPFGPCCQNFSSAATDCFVDGSRHRCRV